MSSEFIYMSEGTAGTPVLKMWNVTVPCGERGLRVHSHMAFEISLIKNGSGIYSVSGRQHPFRTGDVAVFCSNEQHCITRVDNELTMLNLQFEPRLFWSHAQEGLSPAAQGMLLTHSPDFAGIIPSDGTTAVRLAGLISEIEREFINKKPEYRLQIKSLLNSMLIILIRDTGFCNPLAAAIDTGHLKVVRTAMTVIEQNITEPLYLNDLACKVGMSPAYFSALFKKISGISLCRYINEQRISMAMRLLYSEPQLTVLDIAVKCGYNNTANFNKAFKAIAGMTPGDYKKFGATPLS